MDRSGHLDLNKLQLSLEQDLRGLHREEIIKDAIADAAVTGRDSFFIESGAGAGKTTVLARRMISQIQGGARPSEFAVLTYTQEAADELRYKISKFEPDYRVRPLTIYEFGRRVLQAYRAGSEMAVMQDAEIPERLLELLESDPAVLQELRSQYRYIYMDEFQDADRVVSQLLRLLATGNTAAGDDSMLRDGALFVVGDPRQSIYHLQGELCDAFARMKAWMLEQRSRCANVNVITFRLNFRTDQSVLDYINIRFSHLIPGYIDMQAGRKSAFPVNGVYYLEDTMEGRMVRCAEGFTGPSDAIEQRGAGGHQKTVMEAERVGRYLQRLMQENRTLSFKNFMVVTWNQESCQVYSHVLAWLGICTDDSDSDHVQSDRGNVVRVLDVYAAKGLAGDIVFVESGDTLRQMNVYRARQLEYVASTRARHALIFAARA